MDENNMQVFNISDTFPALVTLKKQLTFSELLTVLPAHMPTFEQLLLKRGALLFRGFPLKEPKEFVTLIKEMKLGKFANYIGGDSPRSKIMDGIYTSTEAPANIYIPLHQELSYLPTYPKHIYFFLKLSLSMAVRQLLVMQEKFIDNLIPNLLHVLMKRKLSM
nr:TauD/TfdA family dioxygenase [Legionella busanensis]